MDEAIQEKCAQLKAYKALKKRGKTAEDKEAEITYKRMAKQGIWLAKSEAEKEEFDIISPDNEIELCEYIWSGCFYCLFLIHKHDT